LYFGILGSAIFLVGVIAAFDQMRRGWRRARGTWRAPIIFALGYAALFFASATSLVRTMALCGIVLAMLSEALDGPDDAEPGSRAGVLTL